MHSTDDYQSQTQPPMDKYRTNTVQGTLHTGKPRGATIPILGMYIKRNVTKKLKRAKKNFFKSLDPSNPKSFWKAAKIMTKKKSRIPVLKPENGELISDDLEKAETLNKFFSNCFNTCEPPLTERSWLLPPPPQIAPQNFCVLKMTS